MPTLPGQTSSVNPQLTDANGAYSFSGLHADDYCVEELMQQNWLQTVPCAGPAVCPFSIGGLRSGDHLAGFEFGNFEEPNPTKTPELLNLFLCVAPFPACQGPGEGKVVIIEKVKNVHTQDQNGDSIEDGLGAYEFDVEYDNLAIQSILVEDIVFSPGGAGAP